VRRNAGSGDLDWVKIMKQIILNKYSTAAIGLLIVAVILVAITLITDFGEFVTAAFVISGAVCAMTGIFILMFSGGEPIDPRLVGILPAQCSINLSRIASDLGITGNAYFLPPRLTEEAQVMQFNPQSTYNGSKLTEKGSFPEKKPSGLVTLPSCNLLIQDLKKRNALEIPHEKEKLTQLLHEIIEEIFELAQRVSASWDGGTVTITFHRYRFIEGCQVVWQESPHCCSMYPCPACSLCGAMIAEGLGNVVTLDRCSMSSSSQDVTAIFSILPVPDGFQYSSYETVFDIFLTQQLPKDEGFGSSH
jgi:hypothetical protein